MKAKKKPDQPRKVGRPSKFTNEMMDSICARLSLGESMRKICLDPAMPEQTTMFKWLREIPEFAQQYARAKEESAETYADEMMDIADGMPLMNPVTGAVDSASVNHQRLRVDTRKWIASKLKPKKYGDKVALEHSGKVGLESLIAGAGDEPSSD